MATVEISDALIPEGFKATGEYRIPRENEYYVSGLGLITGQSPKALAASQYTIPNGPRVILHKIRKQIGWKFVRTGKPTSARKQDGWYEIASTGSIYRIKADYDKYSTLKPAYPLRREPIYEGESS